LPEDSRTQTKPVLCVDMDGTLLATDSGWELLLSLIKRAPLAALTLMFQLLRGRACFKRRLAQLANIDAARLPYRPEILALLRREHARGRYLVLATGADELIAREIASHVGLFSEVLASDGKLNLRGREKADKICQRFAAQGFDYIGNSFADLHVWRRAGEALVVEPSPGLLKMVRRTASVTQIFQPASGQRIGRVLATARVYQWIKNLLLFAPLVLAHDINQLALWLKACLAFVSFCLCASAGYALNDLLDLDSDRTHPIKRFRPLAAAQISIRVVGLLVLVCALIGVVLSVVFLPARFTELLLLYLAATAAYSTCFKRFVLVDVFVLAGLYTLRILAGGAAVNVPISRWLAAFSMFFFLSLAFAKRFSELRASGRGEGGEPTRPGYRGLDVSFLQSVGAASGYLAALVMAFYVDSPEVKRLYSHPQWLWLACPLLLYWISRLWLFAQRGEIREDPLVFALSDKASYLVALCLLAVIWLAL
jgi:4-hydroxybenzoate polyprenyltransferase/phosphoserine phosphatase